MAGRMGAAPEDRLDSWKQIASYLGRSTRTVQRWERAEGLPVHRLQHDKLGSVYAYRGELDAWWAERRTRLQDEPEAAAPSESPPPAPAPVATPAPARRPRWIVPALVTLVAALAALTGLWSRRRDRPPAPRGAPPRIAVLPFSNFTGQSDRDYLSDGLTEELIATLGTLPELGVIARTSVMKYKGTQESVADIGRTLQVDYVLEGSVRGGERRLRVTAQLIRVSDQTHLWAESYDRPETDLLDVQGEVSRRVAEEVRVRLPPPPHLRVDPEAYLLYLRGRYHWNKRTGEGFREALSWFAQARQRDAGFARAWAGTADTYVLMSNYGHVAPAEAMPRAREAAQRAVALDETLAEGHASLGHVLRAWDWDFEGAEREFRRALELNPNYALASLWYGIHLTDRERYDEARAVLRRGLESDPLSTVLRGNLTICDFYERKYDVAIPALADDARRHPESATGHLDLARAYAAAGRLAEAVAAIGRARALAGSEPMVQALWGYIHARAGHPQAARDVLNDLERRSRSERVAPYYLALLELALGRNERAIAYLDRTVEERHVGALSLAKYPEFDALRSEPRFQALMQRIGPSSTPP
jgi:TolB-like protein/tetratricopeptide (TPR) repeat protein